MFGVLTTCYLFLGGAGAGALVVLAALEAANARRRFAYPPRVISRVERAFALPDEFFVRAWPLCFVTMALGVLCLLFDLGRPDRLLNLVMSPAPSAIAVGAYALAAALVCAGAFALTELLDGPRVKPTALFVASALGAAAGLVALAYTGVLLQGLASVLFWQTPLLPLLFSLSSLSCGVACAFMGAVFVEARRPFARPLARLARVDGVLIVLEALCLVVYLVWGLSAEGTAPAAKALIAGDLRWLFWGGVVAGGLVGPFVLERFLTHGNSRTQLLWIAALLAAGGLALRFALTGAAAYDVTQMPEALFGLMME
ncbi:NrfD/PsrC family molybdoenzyme membrane anchor subunit [Gordonibacter sp. KGMB07426]|uniref:NrfD/PsrC family molybdoenzyme membrane anchor subunit n=1 Tax=Gordonibacter sp. KGMB07426 TaxID=3404046 RepID=UPI003B2833AC